MKGEKAMKKFETPEIKVATFAVEDIIAVSGGNGPSVGDDDMGWG